MGWLLSTSFYLLSEDFSSYKVALEILLKYVNSRHSLKIFLSANNYVVALLHFYIFSSFAIILNWSILNITYRLILKSTKKFLISCTLSIFQNCPFSKIVHFQNWKILFRADRLKVSILFLRDFYKENLCDILPLIDGLFFGARNHL